MRVRVKTILFGFQVVIAPLAILVALLALLAVTLSGGGSPVVTIIPGYNEDAADPTCHELVEAKVYPADTPCKR